MSSLSPARFSRFSAVVVAVVLATSALIAAFGIPKAAIPEPSFATRLLVALGLCMGPYSGWALALGCGEMGAAWLALSFITCLCLAPLAFAVAFRSDVALVIASALWVGAGYIFTVGIRI